LKHTETLLIVEDNPVLREGLQEMLDLEGFAVIAAANGREALEKMSTPAHNGPIDLILSDIAMPEMDGYAFFRAVRSRPEWISIPFLFLTARGEKQDILAGKDLGADDYLIKPLSREELLTAVRARLDRSQELRVVQLQQAYETSLTVLANAIEVRDQYTRGHVERVMAYSFALAESLGWRSEAQREQLRFGAILHDIGKIHIPEAVLRKRDPLTPAEWGQIRQHPISGAEMVRGIDYLAPAVAVIRCHHERWDGAGYPEGLAGEQIPLAARIVTVADGFDAMTTARPYSPARSPQEAYEEVLSQAGSQYDPAVVAAFCQTWEAWRIQSILLGK
jgi:putative two-component system response regulator